MPAWNQREKEWETEPVEDNFDVGEKQRTERFRTALLNCLEELTRAVYSIGRTDT